MAVTDNRGYVKHAMAGILGLLMAQSVASAESKFLSLSLIKQITGSGETTVRDPLYVFAVSD